MAWSFILTDFSYNPLGEILNATERQIALPLNKLDTLSFKVRLDNPMADVLTSTSCYIKAYQNSTLRYFGPVISAEESADNANGSVAVNSVGAGWVLTKRLAGKSATGQVFSAATDRGQIVKSLIDTTNTEDETGISTAGTMASGSAVTYTAGPYRAINDIITELGASLDGFDWRILPIDNFSAAAVTGPKIAQIVTVPTWGIDQTNSVFEFGTGRNNVASYTRTVTRDGMANKVYHYTSNGPDAPAYPTVSAINTDSISSWKLLEDLAQADIVDATLRQRLVDEHVRLRKTPRQIIQFSPHIDPSNTGRIPVFGMDYDVGDRVVARAVYNRSVRFNGLFRVWGVTFNLDDINGMERTTLALVDE